MVPSYCRITILRIGRTSQTNSDGHRCMVNNVQDKNVRWNVRSEWQVIGDCTWRVFRLIYAQFNGLSLKDCGMSKLCFLHYTCKDGEIAHSIYNKSHWQGMCGSDEHFCYKDSIFSTLSAGTQCYRLLWKESNHFHFGIDLLALVGTISLTTTSIYCLWQWGYIKREWKQMCNNDRNKPKPKIIYNPQAKTTIELGHTALDDAFRLLDLLSSSIIRASKNVFNPI